MKGTEAVDHEISSEEIALEEDFRIHTDEVGARETVPKRLGFGRITKVSLGSEFDTFVIELPDGTTSVVRLDTNPSSTVGREYAFLETVGVRDAHQLDAQHARVPVTYRHETDEWIPIFPWDNHAWRRKQFQLGLFLLKHRVYAAEFYDDTSRDRHVDLRIGFKLLCLIVLTLWIPLSLYGPFNGFLEHLFAVFVLPILVFVVITVLSIVAAVRVGSDIDHDGRSPGH